MFHGWIPTVIQALGEFVLHCAAWVNNLFLFFWLVAKPLSLFPDLSLPLSLLGRFHRHMKCQIITHQGSNDLATLSATRVDNYHVRRAAGLQMTCLDKLHDEAWTLSVTEKVQSQTALIVTARHPTSRRRPQLLIRSKVGSCLTLETHKAQKTVN